MIPYLMHTSVATQPAFTQAFSGNYPLGASRLTFGQLPLKARGSPYATLLPNAGFVACPLPGNPRACAPQ